MAFPYDSKSKYFSSPSLNQQKAKLECFLTFMYEMEINIL